MNWRQRVLLILSVLGLGRVLSPLELCAAPGGQNVSVQLGWSSNGNEAGFGIDRSNSPNGPWKTMATVGGSQTTYVDTGLRGSTLYYYRVWAFNAAGDSDYSNIASVLTASPIPSHPGPSPPPGGGGVGGAGANHPGPSGGHGPPHSPVPISPAVAGVNREGSRAWVSFGGTNGCIYALEYKNSLSDVAWTSLPGTIKGSGNLVNLVDSNAPAGTRFYRIRVQSGQ